MRFTYDPLHRGLHTGLSDHRENFFGPSSRIKLEGEAEAEKARLASAVFAGHKAEQAKAQQAEAKVQQEKEDRKAARQMAKAEAKRAKAERSADEAFDAQLGLEFALMDEARQRGVEASRSGPALRQASLKGPFELGTGDKPNSGLLIFDDQRYTFIPQLKTIPAPGHGVNGEGDRRAKSRGRSSHGSSR